MVEDNPYVMLVSPHFVSALLKFHEKLEGKNVKWILSGDLGEAFKSVRVAPDCVEIVTSKEGAEQINQAVAQYAPQPVEYRVQQLPRNALVQGQEFPVYVRSYSFEFKIDQVPFRVFGDLQFKLGDWEWGDTFEFEPDTIYVVNRRTLVAPLQVKYELYHALGWMDRAEKIKWVAEARQHIRR